MFSPDGGVHNVVLALINFVAIVFFAWAPMVFVAKKHGY